jgi:DNA-binding MarR family transcriptional regulator
VSNSQESVDYAEILGDLILATSSESKKVCSPKSRVQFDTSTVRTWVLPLLMRIGVGDYPTKAGRIIGLSRQHTWYYVRKLEECGFIRREKRSNVVFYELTSESKNLLASCEGAVFPARLYRFDKCQVAYEIIADGIVPENFKKVEMVNWTALLGTELGVRVRKTTRSWIVHVEVIRGRNPIEVTNLAMNLANRVRNALVSKYGCVLGEGKVVAGEMAVEDPVASLFGRYFTVRTDKRKIDHSWSVGELEHLQRDAVIEYLQMPERVKNVECQIGALRGDLSKLTEALSRLCNLDNEEQPTVPKSQGGNDYVF